MKIRPLALLSTIVVAACASAGQPAGRWTGSVTPTTPGPTCIASRGVLQIADGTVIFAPNDGTWILRGAAESNGTLSAARTQIGANKQPYETTLEARWTPRTIIGAYTTPRCKYEVSLTAK